MPIPDTDLPIFHFHQQCIRVLISPRPCQPVLSDSLITPFPSEWEVVSPCGSDLHFPASIHPLPSADVQRPICLCPQSSRDPSPLAAYFSSAFLLAQGRGFCAELSSPQWSPALVRRVTNRSPWAPQSQPKKYTYLVLGLQLMSLKLLRQVEKRRRARSGFQPRSPPHLRQLTSPL